MTSSSFPASRSTRTTLRDGVRVTIAQLLDDGLPPIYSPSDYEDRCTANYQHVYDAYIGPNQNIYTTAA